MKKKRTIVLLAVVVFLVQAACAVGGTPAATTQAPAPVENTGDPIATGIALTLAAQQVVVAPSNTPKPLEVLPTRTPEVPTITSAPSVQGTVNYGANCRTGPGANFPNVVVYQQGTLVNVIGKNNATDGSYWWLVSSSGQADCWLIDAAVTISGDKASVAILDSPPTPTSPPAPTWNGTWTFWMWGGFDGASESKGSMTFTQSGNVVTSTFYNWGLSFTYTGTVSADGMTVNGVLVNSIGGSFIADLFRNPSNLNQFRGSWANAGVFSSYDGAWCGATAGAGQPSPCKK